MRSCLDPDSEPDPDDGQVEMGPRLGPWGRRLAEMAAMGRTRHGMDYLCKQSKECATSFNAAEYSLNTKKKSRLKH
jgi:hypothetical protein